MGYSRLSGEARSTSGLTGGGDAPGLNAVIRAVVKSAHTHGGYEVLGIRDGYDGLLDPAGIFTLTPAEVRGILPRGGTILGAANRGNPFARTVMKDGVEVVEDVSDESSRASMRLHLDSVDRGGRRRNPAHQPGAV
jgi:6-phosphofructokinase 1